MNSKLSFLIEKFLIKDQKNYLMINFLCLEVCVCELKLKFQNDIPF